MPVGNIIQALLKLARVALASLLLVGVPMADAFACGSEELPVSVSADTALADAPGSVASSSPSEHGSEPAGDAQHCIHGHCHHATPFRASDEGVSPYTAASAAVMPHASTLVVTRVSSGLERPPKA